jgi:hypothetical protein
MLDIKIFGKINTNVKNGILALETSGIKNVFLNTRACFWIKAFSFSFDSKEFKGLSFDEKKKWHILAILNSSLVWWHWIAISDCWHITRKELDSFRVPNSVFATSKLAKLGQMLESELERTKLTINTKQAEFEYKHRLCKSIIDQIDNGLADHYDLTVKELEYIKSFAKKYRESLGA